jgi:hypothetical protein
MKVLASGLLAAALALAPPAAAETSVSVDGIGIMKCSAIISNLKQEPTKATNAILGWALGYMGRRNVERAVAGQTQVDYYKVPPEKILGVITGFCGENPDTRLIEIADTFYEVLLKENAPTV